MKILIASSHGYKVRETKTFLKKLGEFDIFSLADYPSYQPPKETGATPEENAIQKGLFAAQTFRCWTIADDSMLIIPALGGLPGRLSSSFAGENASEKDNRKKLLEKMLPLEHAIDRSAYFECCVVLISPFGKIYKAQASCEGMIVFEERGSSGFGYDPLFLKHDYKQTYAELSEEIKNQVSHRAKALVKLQPYVEDAFAKYLLTGNESL
ncbi:non-canonical purine NTP pyrophosphatase [Chlamydia sp.]|uniref:non-canonical purine NTP pyrophosphatase n=1 Tax=Chlamydia sp. TaxID=35827 RepID=UPI0025BCAC04|nr:non-canonical purine NTP pyrophosphatase [Chlamydia sp.]MBQ8498900.1 non-canonical purine NTP pyrophosphatase [Chlamydia sp.]